MSWRDPDHLPDLPSPWECIADDCDECNGSGEVIGIRGRWVKCEHCKGEGVEPFHADEPDYDYYEDRDL